MNKQVLPHFIVIDDDYINNLLCREYILLAFPAADVHTFIHPQEGLDYILERERAGNAGKTMLFLDINMPVLTGWDILETFNEYPEGIIQQLTIYILTSSVDYLDREKAGNNPLVAGFIEKPLSIPELQKIFPGLVIDL